MSWATHELENYVIVKHTKTKTSFLFVALGAFLPDLFTKGFVYGVHVGSWGFSHPANPIQFHRGWPGVGFTHSLLWGVLCAVLLLRFTRERSWALGLLIGHVAHVVTDINDTAGTMLMFPFSTVQITTGMWKHAAYEGRYGDAAAYYSSLGAVWDTFWLGMVLIFSRKSLTKQFFREVVVPADPRPWGWLQRRFRVTERGLVALYRGWIFYGGCRIVAWFLFARFRSNEGIDLTWGGPQNIQRYDLYAGSWWRATASVALGAVGVAVTLAIAWRLVLRRWWAEAHSPDFADSVPTVTAPVLVSATPPAQAEA